MQLNWKLKGYSWCLRRKMSGKRSFIFLSTSKENTQPELEEFYCWSCLLYFDVICRIKTSNARKKRKYWVNVYIGKLRSVICFSLSVFKSLHSFKIHARKYVEESSFRPNILSKSWSNIWFSFWNLFLIRNFQIFLIYRRSEQKMGKAKCTFKNERGGEISPWREKKARILFSVYCVLYSWILGAVRGR